MKRRIYLPENQEQALIKRNKIQLFTHTAAGCQDKENPV